MAFKYCLKYWSQKCWEQNHCPRHHCKRASNLLQILWQYSGNCLTSSKWKPCLVPAKSPVSLRVKDRIAGSVVLDAQTLEMNSLRHGWCCKSICSSPEETRSNHYQTVCAVDIYMRLCVSVRCICIKAVKNIVLISPINIFSLTQHLFFSPSWHPLTSLTVYKHTIRVPHTSSFKRERAADWGWFAYGIKSSPYHTSLREDDGNVHDMRDPKDAYMFQAPSGSLFLIILSVTCLSQ